MSPLDYNLIRSSPTKIYLGEAPYKYTELPDGVKVVFNFCGWSAAEIRSHTVLTFPLVDADFPNFCPRPRDMYEFLEAAHVFVQVHDTYWHCQAGINRSALMLAAYLHTYDENYKGMDQVIHALRQARGSFILNNRSFEQFLRSL